MILNLVTGRPHVATVKVTTTAGATVTCVLSPYSFSATANSSGVASFVVPKIGTWVCTAKSGSITKSANASVTSVGQTVNLTITLTKYLYHDGTQDVAWTYDASSSAGSDCLTIREVGYATTAIDLSGYSTLHLQYTATGPGTLGHLGYWKAGTTPSPYTLEKSLALNAASSKTAVTLDISSVTGSKLVGVGALNGGNGIKVYQVYLT